MLRRGLDRPRLIRRKIGLVEFTKLNGDAILVNPYQIEAIELIPESKIIMLNGRFHIVKEGKEEIIERITRYRQKICSIINLEV